MAGKAARKTAAKKAVRKAAPKRAAPRTAASTRKAPAARRAAPRARKAAITPEQALANTRALLEAKQEHDRQPPPWQALEGGAGQSPQSGFQSDEARAKANELHAAESRMDAIQGSIGTQDRHQQGRRDARK